MFRRYLDLWGTKMIEDDLLRKGFVGVQDDVLCDQLLKWDCTVLQDHVQEVPGPMGYQND